MKLGTWVMLGVCIAWFVLFIRFTYRDLRDESRKTAILASKEPLDPFLFSGEKARTEAREQYEKDPVAREYFDATGVTPFLKPEETGQSGDQKNPS